jgi:DNA-directed RNA polymerase specialized sigma24 family protein
MEQLRHGHPDAVPILFDRFHQLVLKIALRILRETTEAEDVMQDIFIEIFKKSGQFDPEKVSAKTWILQYAYLHSLSRRQYLALRHFNGILWCSLQSMEAEQWSLGALVCCPGVAFSYFYRQWYPEHVGAIETLVLSKGIDNVSP